MNKLIQDQLLKCHYIDLNGLNNISIDKNKYTYHILKYTKPKYEIGSCYIIKVSRELVNNQASTYATNWNHGTSPQYEYLKIYINKKLALNIYVDSIGFNFETKEDINIMWSGWLNINDIEQIADLQ